MVSFSRNRPERGGLLFDSHEWAQCYLDLLNSWGVSSEGVFCRFELEENAGVFAIVCTNYPVT